MASSKQAIVSNRIRPWAEAACAQSGCILWDVEYLREGGEYYLRVTIDKEGGVGIEDCEKVSRILNDVLDTEDPIEDSYSFQVSSPGVERELKCPAHFQSFIGKAVRVRLYKALDGAKEFVGVLTSYADDTLTLTMEDDSVGVFPLEQVSKVKAYYNFEF